ncbi:MAG: alpha/beta hydrolase [Clostridium sp.]|nr:alpha/beta hydrolase [Clostridium sp.]
MSSPSSKLPNLTTKTEEFISAVEKEADTPLYELTPEEAREFLIHLQEKTARVIDAEVFDRNIFTENAGNIEIRVVRPKNSKDKTLPVILYIHGGGWIMGGPRTHDLLVRQLANCTESVVIFPDYALSPEAKYPVALEQIYGVLTYIYENPSEFNIDENRIVIAGDSAGGNMATVTAMKAKKQNGPKILFQALFYPVTNADMDTTSYEDFADGPWLTRKAMEWFWDAYAPDKKDRDCSYVSPLKASEEELKDMPPTLIITDENDVLRDEGEAYARKLDFCGVDVLSVRLNGTHHDFMMLNALSETTPAKGAMMMACDVIKRVLYK